MIRNKAIILFENEFYSIKSIPLNNRIDIKTSLMPKNSKTLDRDYYDGDDKRTLQSSQKIAEEIIKEYFRFTTKKEKQHFEEAKNNLIT